MNWAAEHRFVQELVAHSAVEAFHKPILHWLAGRDVVPFDLMRGAPVEDRIRGQFCSIVGHDHARLSAPFDQDGQFARHPTPGNRGVRYRGKTLAGHVIYDVQDAEPPSAAELVMHEPKVREAKSSDQRAFARASTKIGARVPMALRRARRLRTVRPSSR